MGRHTSGLHTNNKPRESKIKFPQRLHFSPPIFFIFIFYFFPNVYRSKSWIIQGLHGSLHISTIHLLPHMMLHELYIWATHKQSERYTTSDRGFAKNSATERKWLLNLLAVRFFGISAEWNRETERVSVGRSVGTIPDWGRPRLLDCNMLYEQIKEAAWTILQWQK